MGSLTEKDFRNLLDVVSNWYDRYGYVSMLKVLYSDLVINTNLLYSASTTVDLMNLLVVSGHLNPTHTSVVLDTMKATRTGGLTNEIRRIPSLRDTGFLEEEHFPFQFSYERLTIMRIGMKMRNEDTPKICRFFGIDYTYADVWSLIFDLERRMIISGKTVENFTLNLERALEVLQDDLDVEIPIEISAYGPKELKVFNEALSEGKVIVNQGRTMFMGLERVGKTSTIKSFLKQPFEEGEDITDAVANIRTVCTQDANGESDWKETEIDDSGVTNIYEEGIADIMVKKLSEKGNKEDVEVPTKKIAITKKMVSSDIRDNAGTSTGDIQEGQSSPPASRSMDIESDIKGRRKHTQTQPINEVPENIASKVQEKINQIKFTGEATSEWRRSGKDFFMNVWDFGGQPVYHVIQRIFLVSFAIVCVVFNLEDDLDSPANVKDPTTGKPYDHRMTNLEFILYWIRSAYTHSIPGSKLNDGQPSPSVLVIGTHLGSLEGSETQQKDKAEEIFSKIRKAIVGKPYEAMVFSTFFPIENRLPFTKSNAASIMNQIGKFAKKMVRSLPLKWLHVQQKIQNLKKKKHIYLPTKEIMDLVHDCGVTIDAQRVLLKYLHNIGEILYFPDDEALKGYIVLDLMRIVDMFKTVITVKKHKLQNPALITSWRRLDSGILEVRLLRHLWKQFDFSDVEFDFFVSLMQEFGLMCKKNNTRGDERVFYVLSRLKPECVNSPLTENGNCAVTLFHDFSGYLPDDLFQHGVTKFIEQFEVENSTLKLAYEHVELNIDDIHKVVLNVANIKHRRMFQTTIIRLTGEDEPSPTLCKEVLNFLETRGLKIFSQRGARGVELTLYIPCECSPNIKDAHIHLVRKFRNDELPCRRNGKEVARYRRLFGDSMPMEAVPQSQLEVDPYKPEGCVDDITIEVVSVKIGLRRKKFGVRLGLTWSEVNKFNAEAREEAVSKMMWYWRRKIQSSRQHQLKLLCTALRHHGFKEYADSLFEGDINDESTVIADQTVRGRFSDQDLLFICDRLDGVGWSRVGMQLGFEKTDIDDIRTHNDQCQSDSDMHMFVRWRNILSDNDQISTMIKALNKQQYDDLAKLVCERHDGYNYKAVNQNRRKGDWWYWAILTVLIVSCILFVVFRSLADTLEEDNISKIFSIMSSVATGVIASISFYFTISDKLKENKEDRKLRRNRKKYSRLSVEEQQVQHLQLTLAIP